MTSLNTLRKKIDEQDKIILEALAKRFEIVQLVKAYKQEHNIAPLQNDRREEIQEKNKIFAETHKLNPKMVAEIFEVIHTYSVKEQE